MAATTSLDIPTGDTIGFEDIVGELFGIIDVGTVVLNTVNETQIMATGREFSILRNDQGDMIGTAGHLIPGMTQSDLSRPGVTYHLLGLRQRTTTAGLERSHIAAFNPGDDDVELSLSLYDGSTGVLEGQSSLIVAGGELLQWNNVIDQMNDDQDGAPKRLEVTTGGPVFVKAFRVNPWGDPVTIDALIGMFTVSANSSTLVDTGQVSCFDDGGEGAERIYDCVRDEWRESLSAEPKNNQQPTPESRTVTAGRVFVIDVMGGTRDRCTHHSDCIDRQTTRQGMERRRL